MGGGKEELREGDRVLGRPKYDQTTLLHQNSKEEKIRGFCVSWSRVGGLYNSGRENMNGMSFNEG